MVSASTVHDAMCRTAHDLLLCRSAAEVLFSTHSPRRFSTLGGSSLIELDAHAPGSLSSRWLVVSLRWRLGLGLSSPSKLGSVLQNIHLVEKDVLESAFRCDC